MTSDLIAQKTLTNGSPAAGANFVTATVTPAANALLVMSVSIWQNSAASAPTATIEGLGLTWQTTVDHQLSSNQRLVVFTAQCAATPGSGALTVTYATPTNNTACRYDLEQFTNHNTASPIGLVTVGNNSGGSSSYAATLTGAARSRNSRTLGVFTAPGITLNPSGGTELYDGTYLEIQYRPDMFVTAMTAITSNASIVVVAGALIEIAGQPAAAVPLGRGGYAFTDNGTWVKPAGASLLAVTCIGGGGGGGSGANSPAASTSTGGGGGGGGAVSTVILPASAVPDSVAVTVGAGGAGGARQTTASTWGNAGASGGASSFGSLVAAGGGLGGLDGRTSSVATVVAGGVGMFNGGNGIVTGNFTGQTGNGAGGGGTAGGLDATNSMAWTPKEGGGVNWLPVTPGAPGSPYTNVAYLGGQGGGSALGYGLPGAGGGGTYPQSSANDQPGGNGGLYGGGGGGGAMSNSNTGSGSGGNGGPGCVVVAVLA